MRDIKPVAEGDDSVATVKLASDREHSLWGGSSAAVNVACPARARLVSKVPEGPPNEAAVRGEAIHDAIDLILDAWGSGMTVDEAIDLAQRKGPLGLDDDEMWVAQYCAAVAIDRLNELVFAGQTPRIYHEVKVRLHANPQEFYGYVDLIVVTDSTIDQFDWKSGRIGVEVRDLETGQLNRSCSFYLQGVLDSDLAPTSIEEINAWIVQPRAGGVKRTQVTIDEIEQATEQLVEAHKISKSKHAPANVGDWCRYCRAKPLCAAHYSHVMEPMMHISKDPALIDPDQMSQILDRIDEMRRWLDDVEGFAIHQIQSGVTVKGWGVVPGRATKRWADEDAVRQRLRQTNLSEDEYAPRKLASPAQLTKLIKELGVTFDDLIEAKSSTVKLVRLEV